MHSDVSCEYKRFIFTFRKRSNVFDDSRCVGSYKLSKSNYNFVNVEFMVDRVPKEELPLQISNNTKYSPKTLLRELGRQKDVVVIWSQDRSYRGEHGERRSFWKTVQIILDSQKIDIMESVRVFVHRGSIYEQHERKDNAVPGGRNNAVIRTPVQ